MCKSLWQFLGPRLYTWYTTQRCCFLPQLKCFPPRWLSSPLKTVGGHQRTWITYFHLVERCRSFWKTFHRREPEADPRGQPLVVAHPSLVVSWLILTLFFLFVKYDPIRVSKLLEKPYALSLLIRRGGYSESNAFDMSVDKTPTTFLLSTACFHLSTNPIKEVSQFWPFRYAVRLLFNMGSINDVSCLLSNCSKTSPITVKNAASLVLIPTRARMAPTKQEKSP